MKAKLFALAPQSFGYILCNSIRAVGALSAFLVAFASIKYGNESQYGLFLFVVSILSFLPDYFSGSAANEYLSQYSLQLSRKDQLNCCPSGYQRYKSIFNIFLLSCILSFVVVLLLPLPSGINIRFNLVFLSIIYIYFRQHLLIFSQKVRLHLTAIYADLVQYVIPQVIWFSLLFVFHFSYPLSQISATHIAGSAAVSYLLSFICVLFTPKTKLYLIESVYSLRLLIRAIQELLLATSKNSIFFDNLALGAFFAHIVSRAPSVFIGYALPSIGSVAIYGILQRVQFLILIPAFSYISFNMKSLSNSFARKDRNHFWRLTIGLLLISTFACILFLLGYFFFNNQLNWIFGVDGGGVGLQINNSLLVLAVSLIVPVALQNYCDSVMIVYGLTGIFKWSELSRLAIVLVGFVALILLRAQSLPMVYLVEAASLITAISLLASRLVFKSTTPL